MEYPDTALRASAPAVTPVKPTKEFAGKLRCEREKQYS
jgi:hypothetical protein